MFLVKWAVIGVLIMVAVAVGIYVIGVNVLGDPGKENALVHGSVRDSAPDVGGAQFDYKVPEHRVPRDLEDEREAAAITLIPERQARPLPSITAPAATEARFADLARRFLAAWETFAPEEARQDYEASLASSGLPDALPSLSSREDTNDPDELGPCSGCTTGARFTDQIDPGLYVSVRRLDEDSAYITTQGVIEMTGPRSSIAGQRYRRSYALILSRLGDEWRVERAVAETLGAA